MQNIAKLKIIYLILMTRCVFIQITQVVVMMNIMQNGSRGYVSLEKLSG